MRVSRSLPVSLSYVLGCGRGEWGLAQLAGRTVPGSSPLWRATSGTEGRQSREPAMTSAQGAGRVYHPDLCATCRHLPPRRHPMPSHGPPTVQPCQVHRTVTSTLHAASKDDDRFQLSSTTEAHVLLRRRRRLATGGACRCRCAFFEGAGNVQVQATRGQPSVYEGMAAWPCSQSQRQPLPNIALPPPTAPYRASLPQRADAGV